MTAAEPHWIRLSDTRTIVGVRQAGSRGADEGDHWDPVRQLLLLRAEGARMRDHMRGVRDQGLRLWGNGRVGLRLRRFRVNIVEDAVIHSCREQTYRRCEAESLTIRVGSPRGARDGAFPARLHTAATSVALGGRMRPS